ncbi:RluA family pseudouridine synthase [Sphingomicrobium sp. XHP0239]|uniref:RluA family pseudouridine synthase n=1 Tax=Sphingomicrobium maritimum TaxID=3133972 RepID=UPI0031CC3D81
MSDDVRNYTVEEEDDGIRLDRWFKRHQPETSFGTIAKWARTGQLRLDGGRTNPGDRIATGMQIRVPPDTEPRERPQKAKVDLTDDELDAVQSMVIAKTPDAYVLNKPPGLATQGGTKTNKHLDRLLHGLDEDDKGKPKLVHRLDKDTSGVILVARGPRAAAHFSKAFSGRTAKKVYWAIVTGFPEVTDGIIDLPLSKQPGSGGEKMHVDMEEGQTARTKIRVIDRAGSRASFVELQPLTGRTHQLRAHMAAVGHPIVGDAKYGGADAMLTGGVSRKLHLHARRLRISAPGGKTIDRQADLPTHFAESLANLGFEARDGDNLPLTTPDPGQSLEAKIRRKKNIQKDLKKERKVKRSSRGARGRGNPARKPPRKGRRK